MFKIKSLAVIGAGHLGSALIRGLIRSDYPASEIIFSNRDPSKANRLVKELHVLFASNNIQAVEHSDVVVLAVKPQFMQGVCEEISPIIQKKKPLIISLAGVTSIQNMTRWFDSIDLGIVRVMTNTPTEFCKGTSALFGHSISTDQKLWTETLFNKVGYTFWTEQESMIDLLTASIGCSPAYVFLFLEALQQAAMSRGIPSEYAKKIALETVVGSAELATKSGRSFEQLRTGVTTPQGITAHSLEKLSFTDFFDIFKQIYAAAEERIEQINNIEH